MTATAARTSADLQRPASHNGHVGAADMEDDHPYDCYIEDLSSRNKVGDVNTWFGEACTTKPSAACQHVVALTITAAPADIPCAQRHDITHPAGRPARCATWGCAQVWRRPVHAARSCCFCASVSGRLCEHRRPGTCVALETAALTFSYKLMARHGNVSC
jgi:hypothetical protein